MSYNINCKMNSHINEIADNNLKKRPVAEVSAETGNALVKTIVSLALYIGVYYFLFRQNLQWILNIWLL